MNGRKIRGKSGLVLAALLLCACHKDPYNPDNYLSPQQQSDLIRQTVYYSTKLPPNGSHDTKFSPGFNWYYDRAAQETTLLQYYVSDDQTNYFLMSRMARSITPMREGIGGIVRLDATGKLTTYEEVFRTWKMPEDTLEKRGAMLFDRMVKGKDLSLFYSRFQGDRYIEFPDDRFVFDKDLMRWRDTELDSLGIE